MADWDVTLDGVDYMVVPKSYRAWGASEFHDARLGRQRVMEFAGLGFARAGRPADGPAGRGEGGLLDGSGAWPAPWPTGGSAVGPAPAAQAISGTLNSSEPKLGTADGSFLFIAAGTMLFRWNRAVGTAPVNRKTLAAAATAIARLGDALYIAHGASADVGKYVDATNSLTASALGAGVQASMVTTFARALIIVPAASPAHVQVWFDNALGSALAWDLDGQVRAWTRHDDALVIATDAGLYRLSGAWLDDGTTVTHSFRVDSWGSLSGAPQDSDDFAWLLVYHGRLMAWVGRAVLLYDPARDWWEHAGLEGTETLGAAVVNGWLLVSIKPKYDLGSSRWQLWGFNGAGWWLLDQVGDPNLLAFPAADGAGKLVTFRSSGNTARAYDLNDVETSANLASPFSITTPALDAGEPDRRKTWRRAGIELSRLDGETVGSWTVALSYSTDGGHTFTTAGSQAVSTPVASLSFPLSVTASALLLRAQLTRTNGLPPFVTALWAEYGLLDESPRRRRWTFKVHAADKRVNRAGMADPRTGQQVRAALWNLFTSGASFSFRDVDYGASGISYSARMVELREEWPAPAHQAEAGAHTVLEVTLVEA
jgi:hypothetical protein